MHVEKSYESDANLLQSLREENIGAFKALYDKYWEPLYMRAAKRVGVNDAKDLVQEVMTTLWLRRMFIVTDENGELSRYLFTALKYRIISYYTDRFAHIEKAELFDAMPDVVEEKLLETKQLEEFIEYEINLLPDRIQQVFRLSRENDLSVKQIAQILHISEQTVKNQLTEALKRLRRAIRSKGATDNELLILTILSCYYFCS
ncbi:sigma-70 family RNA polymerase sigma factor [Danxiaibacter flavus]|uniref:Sigma-70 family RNA polymerase sigma factor n=1 Tax=Danxiaibacter flavus TaxID=3049108 RepID=A0ABV3ZFF4_9BACT|nr:sigma-70 family RNA polymerase sigma factor [Chitinophagaceae bacterium DXS]